MVNYLSSLSQPLSRLSQPRKTVMGKAFLFVSILIAAVGALALHWVSLAIILILIEALGLVSGAILLRSHSFAEFFEYLRRHAD